VLPSISWPKEPLNMRPETATSAPSCVVDQQNAVNTCSRSSLLRSLNLVVFDAQTVSWQIKERGCIS
jgi:hypothetical protein